LEVKDKVNASLIWRSRSRGETKENAEFLGVDIFAKAKKKSSF
jgi:hypothetical protein